MLSKLLKYDLKNMFKFLGVFYILSFIFSVFTRLLFMIEDSFILWIVALVCNGIFIAMIANILINNIMRLLVRFRSSLYGDESYLTHTLPVKKETLYLNKVLLLIITMVVSFIVIVGCLFISYYSKENINFLKNLMFPFINVYDISFIKILVIVFLILLIEFINVVQIGYTGIILGHRRNNNKIIFSVVYGFVAYMILQIGVLISMFMSGLFNKDIMKLFTSNVINDISSLKILLWVGIISYLFVFIISYFINVKVFKKGVNVD